MRLLSPLGVPTVERSIASNLGYDDAIQELKECYKRGLVSKEDFAAALRGHQAAVDETKSHQREEAANFFVTH